MRSLDRLKYLVYGLLAVDIVLFLQGDLASSTALLGAANGSGIDPGRLITIFAETLDTLAWVLLVVLFELETAVIARARLTVARQWLFSGGRLVCYAVIVSSALGYLAMWRMHVDTVPLGAADPCGLVGDEYFYLAGLDDYPPLDADNCIELRDSAAAQLRGEAIIGSAAAITAASRLALVDVINAVTWIVVVLLLEAEVWLALRGRGALLHQLARRLLLPPGLILVGCALYWLFYGDLLDTWDALLWLFAFVFIELNILHMDTDSARSRPA